MTRTRLEPVWWQNVLTRGYVWESQLGLADEYFGRWHEDVTTELLHASYQMFLQGRPLDQRPLSREALGCFLTDVVGAQSTRLRNRVVGEHWITQDTSDGHQEQRSALRRARHPRGYWFGSLAVAKQRFASGVGRSIAPAVATSGMIQICTVPECQAPAITRGRCAKHTMRLRRYGDFTTVRRAGRKPADSAAREVMCHLSDRSYARFKRGVGLLRAAGLELSPVLVACTRPNRSVNWSKFEQAAEAAVALAAAKM
jgi:hypothetical protein